MDGATSYDVWKDGLFLHNLDETTYADTPGNTDAHLYKVLANYVNGPINYVSAFSPEVSGYASGAPSKLAAPVMKSVSTNLYTYIHISWGEVAKTEKYRLYRSETNVFGDATVIANVSNGLTYDDLGAAVGTIYYYWVAAVTGTLESPPSKSMSGMAAAGLTFSFGDPAHYPTGQTIGVAAAEPGAVKYYEIVVPTGTTRLVATLTGASSTSDNCDVYAKFGCYPTSTSYNAKAVKNATDKVLTVSNPANGTWYFMLYASGTEGYTERDLTVACYSATDIYLTAVPAGDQDVPFTATFKGKVVDKSGTGVAGLTVMDRNPITGITYQAYGATYYSSDGSAVQSWKTNASGIFTFSYVISTEGEHTFDFFFTDMPDTAKGTASHTVFTKNTSLYTSDFDFSTYLRATMVELNAADTLGMQAFLNTSNGWDDEDVDPDYRRMWIDNTIGKVQGDTALLWKLDEGLYLFLYGVEGAGAGYDTATESGISGSVPISGLSPVPLIVHVNAADKADVLGRLLTMGVIDNTTEAQIAAGKVGVVSIASFSDTDGNKDISLSASEQLTLLSNIAQNVSVNPGAYGKYSNILTKEVEVTVGSRKINVITSSFVPDTTAIAVAE